MDTEIEAAVKTAHATGPDRARLLSGRGGGLRKQQSVAMKHLDVRSPKCFAGILGSLIYLLNTQLLLYWR